MKMFGLIALGFCFIVETQVPAGQGQTLVKTDVEVDGSYPPLPGLYSCVRELDGKQFDIGTSNKCLQSILASKYFLEGHIETMHQGSGVVIRFELKAPSLRITDINYGAPSDWQAELSALAAKDPEFLHQADIYDPGSAGSTRSILEMLLESKGKRGVVSQSVHLNYKEKTAQLIYRIYEVADGPRRQLPPPYGEPCSPHIRNFSEQDLNDYVPLSLFRKLSKTRSSFCFSDVSLHDDQIQLVRSGLFENLKMVSSGTGEFRDVSVSAQGKPLVISEILVRAHGLLSPKDLDHAIDLPLQANSSYRRSDALLARTQLTNLYSGRGRHVITFEDDEAVDSNRLRVVLNVLVVPEDELFVDGQQFVDESRVWATVPNSAE